MNYVNENVIINYQFGGYQIVSRGRLPYNIRINEI